MQDIQFSLTSQPTGIEVLVQKANDLMRAAKATSTRKAYQNDWRAFESWCTKHKPPSLPSTPQTIALYIAGCVTVHLAPATISRRLASITKAHQAAGFKDSPASAKNFVVGKVLKGARRTLGVAQKGKDPLLLNDVRRIVATCPRICPGCATAPWCSLGSQVPFGDRNSHQYVYVRFSLFRRFRARDPPASLEDGSGG